MRQSRLMTLVEAFAKVAVGYGEAVMTQALVFPLFGVTKTLEQNIAIGGIFTLVSLARSYLLSVRGVPRVNSPACLVAPAAALPSR